MFDDNYYIVIAGSRSFNDYPTLCRFLDPIIAEVKDRDIFIVSGCARGADKLGEKYAKDNNIPIKRYPANWEKYGKRRAGSIRNKEMGDVASEVIVFWDTVSSGTWNMITITRELKKKLTVVEYYE